MEEIADRYADRSAQLNSGREPDALADVNVVLLLSESFSDPGHLDGVDLAIDPIPLTRQTMARQPSGQVFSNTFGGGTANMEFEALTGMSQALFTPQLVTPFQMLVPKYDRFPSVARYFNAHGHETLGVHPFLKSMFRRSEVYPRLGFDSFLDQTRLNGLAPIGESTYASDESTFREAGRLMESSAEPLFMSLVTMQNHYPYVGRYGDPIDNNLRSAALGQYARGLAHSDQATDRFLEDLKRSREKTLVVFYGDHLPGIYDKEVMSENSIGRIRETPFFIWSSYEQLPATRFPVTSPMYFMPLAFEAAGARVPPYFALLLDLHEEVPVLNGAAPLKPAELSQRARGLLHDLRLVQYDFSVGKRYVTEEMFYAAP
jgi:phosphoglycerol transferase MdoB-like AlkP superfamily enzyme